MAISFAPFWVAAGVIVSVLAQPAPRIPAERIVLSNVVPVPDTWVVMEIQLFFGHCYENRRMPNYLSLIQSSGTRRETPFETADFRAFDGATDTNWTANCKKVLGGCKSYGTYIGLDITETDEYKAAMANRHEHWNVSDPLFKRMEVHCVRIFQSNHPEFKADRIALQEGRFNGDNYTYTTTEILEAVSGGVWARRPNYEGTTWRITNLWQTIHRWAVTELQFFSDDLCSFPVKGAAISSGNFEPTTQADNNAFDDDLTTNWRALCGKESNGCLPEEGFLGMDFGDTVTVVKCMRIYQKVHNSQALISEKASYSTGIALQAWDGKQWKSQEIFWDPKIWSQAAKYNITLAPTAATPFFGGAPGRWEDTRPPDQFAWRLVNDDYTRGQWKVHELEFHESETCAGNHLTHPSAGHGLPWNPLDMQGPINYNQASHVFDGSDGQDLAWESACVGMGGICVPFEAWFGVFLRAPPPRSGAAMAVGPSIRCIRLFQSRFRKHTATSVLLSKYMNGHWVDEKVHRYVGGGSWNLRPAPPWTQWRILNDGTITEQWRVSEVVAYKDPLCLEEVSAGNAITAGYYHHLEGPGKAFDGLVRSWWGSDCLICNISRDSWIGIQLAVDAPDAKAGQSLMRCLKIWQSEKIEEQALQLRVELWDGKDWTFSTMTADSFLAGGSGGIWSRQPASHMTKWRMTPFSKPQDFLWRIEEIQFFMDANCTRRIRATAKSSGGASVIVSGIRAALGSFDLDTRERGFSEVEQASDGDTTTFVYVDHRPTSNRPGWLGIDFLSEFTWVRCVRFRQGPLAVENVRSAVMENWDGVRWKEDDPELLPTEIRFEGLGGGGWQRRPASKDSMWRVENFDIVPQGWGLRELEFYTQGNCNPGTNVSGEPISSGYIPPEDDNGPHFAFDGDVDTTWLAQCGILPERFRPIGYEKAGLPAGCNRSAAWLGMDFGGETQHVVRCVRLIQIGFRQMQSGHIGLSRWSGERWEHAWTLSGMGGSSWEQRPASANTMWRIVHLKRKPDQCSTQRARVDHRAWGIADLRFYQDDKCIKEVGGGIPISSGSIDYYRPSVQDPSRGYRVNNSRDLNMLSTWGSNCNLGWRSSDINTKRTDCNGDWIGLDYGSRAIEVRCLRIVQSRLESALCCDPAEEIMLERWNGTAWIEATWVRDPPVTSNPNPKVITERRHLGAHFMSLGRCPRVVATTIDQETIEEERARRDSDNCVVQLTGATALMAEPYCVDHTRCSTNFGQIGNCCPFGDPTVSLSRCCCSFVGSEPIFSDDGQDNTLRLKLDFEYATIWLSNVLPWIGLFSTVACYFSALFFPKNIRVLVANWCRRSSMGDGRLGSIFCGERIRQFISTLIWPWVEWRHFLAYDEGYASRVFCWFILPNRELPQVTDLWKGMLFLFLGFMFSGMAPWVGIGYIVGELGLRGLVRMSVVIRWFKSKYNPLDWRDMALRKRITHVNLKTDEDTSDATDVLAGIAVTFAGTGVYFMKFIFDMLILRAQMISMGAIETIDADRVVEIFPGILDLLKEPGMLIYSLMYTAKQTMSFALSFSIGIPLCEGSCVLVGSIGLIAVLVCSTQWLNYDLFGMFTAARIMCKSTRPECQKVLSISVIMVMLGISFAVIQSSMVLFTRALMFANPFTASIWMCKHDDRLALYIGRTLLMISSTGGLIFVGLCVNGHFMGQDYIIGRIGRFLEVDLDDLDPDGTSGKFRCNVFGAALPTLFGFWTDWWNVDAFLVAERARVYAEVLWDPAPCRTCGKIHVPYDLMMTATGRTISLTTQIIPYGALLGKASEYLNDPPFFYWGTKLTCMSNSRAAAVPMPVISKKKIVENFLLYSAEFLVILLEKVMPVMKRASSVAIYVCAIFGTFALTEDNLVETGGSIILAGFYCSFVKSFSTYAMEHILSFGLGSIIETLEAIEGIEKEKNNLPRTVVGQLVAGGTVGTLLMSSAQSQGWATYTGSFYFGWIVSYIISVMTLAMSCYLELPAPPPGERPRKSANALAIQIAYSIFVALGTGLLSLRDERNAAASAIQDIMSFKDDKAMVTLRGAMLVMFVTGAAQLISLKLIFLEQRPASKTGIASFSTWRDSPSQVVLRTMRQLSCTLGVPCAVMIGNLFNLLFIGNSVSSTIRNLIALTFGTCFGILLALAVNKMLDNPPQLIGFFAFVACALISSTWNVVFGFGFAVMFGTAIGGIFEELLTRKTLREELQRRQLVGEHDEEWINNAALKQLTFEGSEVSDVFEEQTEPTREDNRMFALEAAAARAQTRQLLAESSEPTSPPNDPSLLRALAGLASGDDEDQQIISLPPSNQYLSQLHDEEDADGAEIFDATVDEPDYEEPGKIQDEILSQRSSQEHSDYATDSAGHYFSGHALSNRPASSGSLDSERGSSDQVPGHSLAVQEQVPSQMIVLHHQAEPTPVRPDLVPTSPKAGNPGGYEDPEFDDGMFGRWERKVGKAANVSLAHASTQRLNVNNMTSRPKAKAPSSMWTAAQTRSPPPVASLRKLRNASSASQKTSRNQTRIHSPTAMSPKNTLSPNPGTMPAHSPTRKP